MSVVTPVAFARLLADLDRELFRAFVFDLWRGRADETTVRDGDIVARRSSTGLTERVRPVTDPADIDGTADVAVVRRDTDRMRRRADAAGVRYVPPASLRDLALYGVDRETADALFREYFDRPVASPDASAVDSPGREQFVRVAAAALLLAVAVVAGVVLSSLPAGDDVDPAADGTVTPVDIGDDTPTPDPSESDDGPANVTRYLTGDAVDAAVLARGHVDALANRSFALRVSHNGSRSPNGRRWIRAERTVRAREPRIYVHQFRGHRAVRGGEVTTVSYREYADGESLYRTQTGPGGPSYDRLRLSRVRTADVYVNRTAVYVERYLATTEVTVTEVLVGGSPVYRLRATGTPTELTANASSPGDAGLRFPGSTVTNYSAVAYVTWSGVVASLDVSYVVDGRPVAFSFSYDALGSTRPAPPPWYDEARNETRADAASFAPASDRYDPLTRSPTNETTSASSVRPTPWPAS